MKTIGKLPAQKWQELSSPILEALSSDEGIARVVGGCVRDALLGQQVSDIDIATSHPPEKVVDLLDKANIRNIPVGVSHGAILAITPHMSFHITTLRSDIETYGRRAKVEFVDDWYEDAKRRDFTMNALYADADGTLYDPVDGLDDLSHGIVRFIGDPKKRIQEDYLRILRFFRFLAYYGRSTVDQEALEACVQLADKLTTLSGERIWYECKKLLLADDPVPVITMMYKAGILKPLFPEVSFHLKAMSHLVMYETMLGLPKSAIRRFSALIQGDQEAARFISDVLKFSTNEKKMLIKITNYIQAGKNLQHVADLNKFLYHEGVELATDIILLTGQSIEEIMESLSTVQSWENPQLPISGRDLMEAGYHHGPALGEILESVENWWLEDSCLPSKDDCLEWVFAQHPPSNPHK
jgi:poly(A) polymerase